jgi:hypothetical protein
MLQAHVVANLVGRSLPNIPAVAAAAKIHISDGNWSHSGTTAQHLNNALRASSNVTMLVVVVAVSSNCCHKQQCHRDAHGRLHTSELKVVKLR